MSDCLCKVDTQNSSQRRPVSSLFTYSMKIYLTLSFKAEKSALPSRYNVHLISEMAECETSGIGIGFK